MECPTCHQVFDAKPCASCGRPALAGAAFCHHCGQLLPPPEGESPKLLTCDSCGRKALPDAHYCDQCAQPLRDPDAAPQDGERIACADGLCIGIIGPDGKCTECGKPLTPAEEA